MTDRYERIRAALAMGPTPGPWGYTELPRDIQRGYKFAISRGGLGWWIAKVTNEANGGTGAANAAYITACDPDTIRALLEERDALRAERDELQRERDELQQSFDLHWRASMRAIKRWQEAHPGSDLTWPDHADLVVWLLEQLDAARDAEGRSDE